MFRKLPAAAAVVALIGLADAVYLTVHHYTAEPVPCGADFDCGAVLSSSYAEIAGIPLAAFGAAAYFTAFSLALLAAFGRIWLWGWFGVQSILMAAFSAWLIYVQYALINAWCQYCLVSAGTSFTLYLLYLISRFHPVAGRSSPELPESK
ncbi:MAG TPA: vitamin K epoxide reductase family protein [Pyrinomonadaceae bacterium]|nr:vitamin K epoxide reductase family protein [Pyrinomonadaceae bacterium]